MLERNIIINGSYMRSVVVQITIPNGTHYGKGHQSTDIYSCYKITLACNA